MKIPLYLSRTGTTSPSTTSDDENKMSWGKLSEFRGELGKFNGNVRNNEGWGAVGSKEVKSLLNLEGQW